MGRSLNITFGKRSACRAGVSPIWQRVGALVLCLVFSLQCILPNNSWAWGEFTYKDEAELGRKFNVLVRSRLPIIHDPEVTNYINYIITRLSKNMPAQPFAFTPAVVASPSVNAFAVPGGYVFAYTGLILAMNHESELAAVMAHEIAHVTQRHIARRMELSQIVSILSVVGLLAGVFMGGDAGQAAAIGSVAAGQAAMLSYSRTDENESDQVGMNYLVAAGYNPNGMPNAFEVLSRKQWLLGSSVPSYLSTHPDLKDRIRETKIRVDRLPAAQRNIPDDDTRFKRIQALIRARYSDPQPATLHFNKELSGASRCMSLMGLGILAARQNRINDASTFFDQALQCSPKDPLVVREAGRFQYTKGDRAKGGALLQQAVALDKNDLMALFFLARHQADSGQLTQAIDNLRVILRTVPEDSEIHLFLARYYGQSRQLFEANLHMAYSALYENDKKKVEQFMKKAGELTSTQAQKSQLARFEQSFKERKEFWK